MSSRVKRTRNAPRRPAARPAAPISGARASGCGERVRAGAATTASEAERGEDGASEDVLERRAREPDTEQGQRQVQPARVEERVREERERARLRRAIQP